MECDSSGGGSTAGAVPTAIVAPGIVSAGAIGSGGKAEDADSGRESAEGGAGDSMPGACRRMATALFRCKLGFWSKCSHDRIVGFKARPADEIDAIGNRGEDRLEVLANCLGTSR